MYIYENPDWPAFVWDNDTVSPLLMSVRNKQGRILGYMSAFGFDFMSQANLETLTLDVLKSSEIEGEILNTEQVRSSLARRLGLEISGLVESDRNVDGVVDMALDATRNYSEPLNKERIVAWHYSLFPRGNGGLYKIKVGDWRDDSKGPMQVVSGSHAKEKVHFQAPQASILDKEMNALFDMINNDEKIDLVLKAAIAHLWFVTLHPFDDGNGRIARAITDLLLSRSDEQSYRFYSMATQIRKERNAYYEILERTQKGDLDITEWLEWFLNCLLRAIENSLELLSKVIFKNNFWLKNSTKNINERQRIILNLLLDGFEGKLNTSKWAKICKCSPDTALRDIQDLEQKDVLQKLSAGGRSTSYELKENFN